MIAIVSVLFSALFNSLWTAISKITTKDMPPYESGLFFRLIVTIILFPVFLFNIPSPTSNYFYLASLLAGTFDVVLLMVLLKGFKKDYYSTYGLFNTSPILVAIVSSIIFGTKLSFMAFFGVIITTIGGAILIFIGKKNFLWGVLSSVLVTISIFMTKWAFSYIDNPFGYPFIIFGFGSMFLMLIKPRSYKFIKGSFYLLKTKFVFPIIFSAIATMSWYIAIKFGNLVIVYTLFRVALIFSLIFSKFILKEVTNMKLRFISAFFVALGTILIFI